MFNQAFQRALLERQGHTVIMVDNGQEDLEVFSKEEFDVIFLDLHMPIKDGLEAAREIRLLNAEIPLIGMTANVTDNARQNCFDSGMNWFLEKPLDAVALQSVLYKRAESNSLLDR